jgi:hypothetical protein
MNTPERLIIGLALKSIERMEPRKQAAYYHALARITTDDAAVVHFTKLADQAGALADSNRQLRFELKKAS